MTKPEVALWLHLRENQVAGLRFRRQHPIGSYILDFYCASARLCIEIDGQTHGTTEAQRYDEARTAWLERQGIRVLRFTTPDILSEEGIRAVLFMIEQAAAPTTA